MQRKKKHNQIILLFFSDNTTIEESAFCAMLDNPPGFPLWELSSLIFFAIPMIVMIVLYARMGIQIRFRSKHASVLGIDSSHYIDISYTKHKICICRRATTSKRGQADAIAKGDNPNVG